jgi:NADH-quinone oxidoreductase subunit L
MHLLAHGFFKALLFLGAGSVIHGVHHEQDIRKMGGLRGAMPITFATYAVGMMALSGVPLFFCGAWTKEEVLHATSRWPSSHVPSYLVMLGVVLTALYMTRQMLYVFFGNRGADAHESPRVMTTPLIVLAICTVLLSVVLTPAWPWLEHYLLGEKVHVDLTKLFQPMILTSLVLVAIGIGLGVFFYRTTLQDRQRDPLESAQPALFRFLANRMWLDELYDATVIRLSLMLARVGDWLDRYVWDGLVRLVALLGQFFGTITTTADERGINSGVDETTRGARGFGGLISRAHSGQIQTYLGAIGLGMLALLLLYAWLT